MVKVEVKITHKNNLYSKTQVSTEGGVDFLQQLMKSGGTEDHPLGDKNLI